MPEAPQDTRLIDEWLASHRRVRGFRCYPQKIKVYFPVEHPLAEAWANRIAQFFSENLGGATVYPAQGWWHDEETSRDVVEENRVIEAAHHCTDAETLRRLAETLREAAKHTGQTALGIEGSAEFYVIPTRKLKLPT